MILRKLMFSNLRVDGSLFVTGLVEEFELEVGGEVGVMGGYTMGLMGGGSGCWKGSMGVE